MDTKAQVVEALTAVVVVSDGAVPTEALAYLSRRLAELSEHSEIVLVANGVGSTTARTLRELLASVPDVTIHFLADAVERDTATLIGMDRALGDWVIVTTPTMREVDAIPQLLAAMDGYDVVFVAPPIQSGLGAYVSLGRAFFALSGRLAGIPLEWPTPRLRGYSRAACRWLCARLDGAVLMRSLAFRGAFPGRSLEAPELMSETRSSTVRQSLTRALHHLGRASTVPLRLAIGLAAGGVAVGLFALTYVGLIYATHDGVQPGWTTLAALLSMMMLVFSALFALLTACMLAMYSSIQPRSRVPVVRELRSTTSRLQNSLDLAGGLAPSTFGVPPELLTENRRKREAR